MAEGHGRLANLGHYQVAERLGAGGMGEVYLGYSPSGRVVAVKVIRDELAAKPGFRERFAREVEAARQVSGAFTAAVVDADTTGPVPWMATQFVDGPSLAAVVEEKGPLSANDVWQLASGLCEALRDIHRAGVVHRDFKPGNILLADDGPRVIDFGISRLVDATALTQSGQFMGTPLFMAPEQFRKPRDVGPPADVFALGAVLVYAATGHGPFDADTPYAVAWNAVHEEPDLTGLPDSLHPVVEPCLRKVPAERPNAEALLTLLSSRRERRAEQPRVRDAAVTRPRLRRLRRRRLALTATTCVAVVVGVALWWRGPTDDSSKGGRTSVTASPKPTSSTAPVRLPGWKAWTTQMTDKETSPDLSADCQYGSAALWCTSHEILAARVDPRTGKVLWQQPGPAKGSPPQLAVTTWAILVIADVGNGSSPSYRLWIFDRDSGKLQGHRPIPGAEACRFSSETLVCEYSGGITVWEPSELERMWSGDAGWKLFISPDSPPTDRIYVVKRDEDERPTAVGEITQGDGTLLWQYDVPRGTDQDLFMVSGDFVYLAESSRVDMTRLIRINRKDGTTKTVELGVPEELMGVVGDVLYTHRVGVISAYSIPSGRRLWSSTTLHTEVSAPVVDGDRVHFTAEDGTAIALDRRTGGALWQQAPSSTSREFFSVLPRPITLGDIVFAQAPGQRLRSFQAQAQ